MKASRLGLWVWALSVLFGSGWLLVQAYPDELGWPIVGCIHFAVIGAAGCAVALARGGLKELRWRRVPVLFAAGGCIFVLPVVVVRIASGNVTEFTSAALFCSVPLMTVLAAGAFSAKPGEARGLLAPAAIGLAGALFLFPIDNPGSLRRWLFLGSVVACCATASVANVWMHRLMQDLGVATVVAVAGLGNAAALGVYAASAGWPVMGARLVAAEMLRCLALDLPEVWLLMWLIKRMNPARLSARFLLAALVTVVEGYSAEPGQVDARAILAMALMGAGGTMLLFKDEPDEVPGLGLR